MDASWNRFLDGFWCISGSKVEPNPKMGSDIDVNLTHAKSKQHYFSLMFFHDLGSGMLRKSVHFMEKESFWTCTCPEVMKLICWNPPKSIHKHMQKFWWSYMLATNACSKNVRNNFQWLLNNFHRLPIFSSVFND